MDEKSYEVEEILGKTPGWLIKWGVTVIFLSLVALILVSIGVKYEEVIPIDMRLLKINNDTIVLSELQTLESSTNIEALSFLQKGTKVQISYYVSPNKNCSFLGRIISFSGLDENIVIEIKDDENNKVCYNKNPISKTKIEFFSPKQSFFDRITHEMKNKL